jgi:hypothetical protein
MIADHDHRGAEWDHSQRMIRICITIIIITGAPQGNSSNMCAYHTKSFPMLAFTGYDKTTTAEVQERKDMVISLYIFLFRREIDSGGRRFSGHQVRHAACSSPW